ncbi:MAG: hypothetical protein K1563_20850 [Candidatus Thiodiazotropha sp. (ex. Lucinisca nassula)]|nr:hypothetical protein [Candidatus Thiodiazotropha sp. (ex. Lucinisca nassula)]MBW9276132.1 hypothetical protein [Candidatus Thiodiazotropha sp. (ex. Lucinisca nassula)]
MKHYLIVFLILAVGISLPGFSAAGKPTVRLNKQLMAKQNQSAYWLAYGTALAAWDPKSVPNIENESFEREVFARSALASIWISMKQSGKKVIDPTIEDLANIYNAGYMREYVWKYLDVSRAVIPSGLREEEFTNWEQSNLRGHVPIVKTGVDFVVE